ncbi:MAG: TolC family protein [Desulfobacterales bacterium]|jgi:TolC family type I secretion outer membrane protein
MKPIVQKISLWILAAISFTFFISAKASIALGISLPESLTLSEAIKRAVDQNPEIKAARFQVEMIKSEVTQARSGFFPQIYFTETFNRTTNPMWATGAKMLQGNLSQADFDLDELNDPEAINNFTSAVSMSWSIYKGGQTWIGLKQAQQNHLAASLMLKRAGQEIISKTAKAYVGLLLAQENLVVIVHALETAKANLKMVRSRFETGFVVKSDFLRANVRIAELEQQRLEAESQVKVAQAMLNAAMGMTGNKPLYLVTPFKKCEETKGPVERWINIALSNRADLEKMRYQEDIAKKEIDKLRAGHLPDLELVGNYEINSEDYSDTENNYAIGAVMHLNLFSGHRISAKTKAAKSSFLRIQEFRKGMELNVGVQARESFLKAQSAWKRIQVAKTAVDQAEEGLRIVRNRYNNGLLTIVGLLDGEVAYQQARTNHFKALHDYKVARIQLALAAGTIDPDFQ